METRREIVGVGTASTLSGSSAREPEEPKKYLIFKVGDFFLAASIDSVRRVHDVDSLPPRTPGTRVIDLHHLTGASTERPVSYWIEMEVGQNKYLMSVEDVEGINEMAMAVALPFPPLLSRPETVYVRRLLFDGIRMIVELEPMLLADASAGAVMHGRSGRPPEPKAGKISPGVSGGGGLSDRLLVFETLGAQWRVDLGRVESVIGSEYVYRIPSCGKPVSGVVYHNERAVPVVSTEWLFDRLKDHGAVSDVGSEMIILVEARGGLLGLGCSRVVKVTGRGVAESRRTGASPVGAYEIRPDELVDRIKEVI